MIVAKASSDIQRNHRRKLRIWPHLLKKSVMENFIFCAVNIVKIEKRIPSILS